MALTDPDWVEPIEMTFDVEKPIRSEQGLMLAGNPIAIANAKNGSPIIQTGWHPYDAVEAGDGATGEIWSFSAEGAVTVITSPTFEDGYEYRFVFDGLSHDAASVSRGVQMEFYRETSAAWSGTGVSPQTITTIPNNAQTFSWVIEVLQPRVASKACFAIITATTATGGANSVIPASSFGIVCANTTPQKISQIRVQLSDTGNFDAGAAYMQRRFTYR